MVITSFACPKEVTKKRAARASSPVALSFAAAEHPSGIPSAAYRRPRSVPAFLPCSTSATTATSQRAGLKEI